MIKTIDKKFIKVVENNNLVLADDADFMFGHEQFCVSLEDVQKHFIPVEEVKEAIDRIKSNSGLPYEYNISLCLKLNELKKELGIGDEE